METNNMIERKVTIYFRSEMFGNYLKIEARSYFTEIKPYAQYPSAVKFSWVPKGARSARAFIQTYRPSLLILDGHGHPDPAPMFGEEKDEGGVSARRSQHLSFSEEWDTEFNEMIRAHVVATKAKVLADFRDHNSHRTVAE